MAWTSRHRSSCRGAHSVKPRARRGSAVGARTPHRSRPDGQSVQGRRDPRRRLAHPAGVLMTWLTRDAAHADAKAIDTLFRTIFTTTFAHLYSSRNLDSFLEAFTLQRWADEL